MLLYISNICQGIKFWFCFVITVFEPSIRQRQYVNVHLVNIIVNSKRTANKLCLATTGSWTCRCVSNVSPTICTVDFACPGLPEMLLIGPKTRPFSPSVTGNAHPSYVLEMLCISVYMLNHSGLATYWSDEEQWPSHWICYHHHHTMALYISYFMSKNSTLVLVLIVSYSTINKVFYLLSCSTTFRANPCLEGYGRGVFLKAGWHCFLLLCPVCIFGWSRAFVFTLLAGIGIVWFS